MKQLLDPHTARPYLIEQGWLEQEEPVEIRELAGGVSNCVLRVDTARQSFVLKQARPRLRVAEPWFCSVERIFRETETLRWCERLLRECEGSCSGRLAAPSTSPPQDYRSGVPELLFEDRECYCFAMQAAPGNHETWKQQLLEGRVDPAVARACGRLLGTLHGAAWLREELRTELHDRGFFDQLRLDPYYRHVARNFPSRSEPLTRLVASVDQHLCSLVHGDFSPKNLLVFDHQVMLVDFEVGHFGDPAFDLGFFLTHLVLKTIHAPPSRRSEYARLPREFRDVYRGTMARYVEASWLDALECRGMYHLAGCLLARIDGKSPVEYLSALERESAADIGDWLLQQAPCSWSAVASRLSEQLQTDF